VTTAKYKVVRVDGRNRFEHVLIAEKALGKPLPDGADVHHVDGNGFNNKNANLVICQDRSYHFMLHARMRVIAHGGDPDTQRFCWGCNRLKAFAEFSGRSAIKSIGIRNQCRVCARVAQQAYYAANHERLREECRNRARSRRGVREENYNLTRIRRRDDRGFVPRQQEQ